jgi:hydroxypyruvate isomerase
MFEGFSVCIDAVFAGVDAVAALAQVRELGFHRYEFWGWWNKDLEALKVAEGSGKGTLSCAAFCTRFVSLTAPKERGDYLAGLTESIAAAEKLGCAALISQVGADTGAPREQQRESVVVGLRAAAPLLEARGITLLVEPLNGRVDHQGSFLESSDEAFAILDEVGSKRVKLLFDIYHQQVSEGDVIRRIRRGIGLIGHFHAAGTPGRHELDRGELNYPAIFAAIADTGYNGLIGLEYQPEKDAVQGLQRLKAGIIGGFND